MVSLLRLGQASPEHRWKMPEVSQQGPAGGEEK